MISGLMRENRKRRYVLLLSLGVVVSLISAHLYVVAQRGDYVGPLIIADHFFNMGLVVALLIVCAAVGLWLLERFRLTFDTPLEALLFSVAIGSGAVAVSILISGLLSVLQPITLASVMVLWVLFARREIVRVYQLITEASIEIKNQGDILSLTVFGAVAVFMLSQALLPPRDWDSLVYQLRVPMQFLQAGKIYLPPDNENVAYVQLAHMLYIPLLTFGNLAGPALLSAFFALFLGLTVFALASRFFDAPTAVVGSTLLWTSPMILLIAITPRIDVTLACYLMLAHFALLKARSDWTCFHLSALLLGLAVGIKLSALLYAAALGPLIVWLAFNKKKQFIPLARHLCLFGLLLLSAAAPWLLKNWLLFNAPLYPFFAEIRIDAWLAFLYPGHNIAPSPDVNGWTVLTQIQAPFNVFDFFFNPGKLAPEWEAAFYATNPLFVAILIWALGDLKNYHTSWLLIPAIFYSLGLGVLSPITNLRYFAPVIAPFTVVAVHITLSRLVNLFGLRRGFIIFRLLAVVLLVPTAKVILHWTSESQNIVYLVGLTSRENFLLATVNPPGYSNYARAVTYVNRNVSPKSRVLMLYEARGFYFRVPMIQDNTLTNWLVLENTLSSMPCLSKTGISHVLFNAGAVEYYLNRGVSPNKLKLEQFRRFAKECLVIVANDPGYVLYRVRDQFRESDHQFSSTGAVW
jgi:hypothetical protein